MECQKNENIYLKLVSNGENWMEAFRQNIGILRVYYGWSVRVLAEKSDVSESTLNKISQGKTNDCDFSIVQRIAKALHVSVDELTGAETMEPETRECVALSRSLADHHRYVIRTYVRHQYKLHGDVPATSKQISVMLPECNNGNLKTTNVCEALDIDHLSNDIRSKVCLGLRLPCKHYEPYFMQNEIVLLAADRDGRNSEKCVISHGGNFYLCIKKIEMINGIKKISYLSLMDGHNKMFDYDEIDDKIGYVVGFLFPDGSWGER